MNHTHPALFVGGPIDGQRKFLNNPSRIHQVPVMNVKARNHGEFYRTSRDPFDFPGMNNNLCPEVVEYECIEQAHGHRLYALRGEKRPDVMARLIGGYHAEGKH